jgi:hypothetical protein
VPLRRRGRQGKYPKIRGENVIFLTFGRNQTDLLFVSGQEIGNQAGRDSPFDTI